MALELRQGPWVVVTREQLNIAPSAFEDWRFRTLVQLMAWAWQRPDEPVPSMVPDQQEIRVDFDRGRDRFVAVSFLAIQKVKPGHERRSLFAYSFGGRVSRPLTELVARLPGRLRPPWAVTCVPSTVGRTQANHIANPLTAMVGAWLHHGPRGLDDVELDPREELAERLLRFSIPIVGGMASPSPN